MKKASAPRTDLLYNGVFRGSPLMYLEVKRAHYEEDKGDLKEKSD